jgi:hypothetical protein
VVETEHDGVEVVGELLGLDVAPEVARFDAGAVDDLDHLEPALLERDEPVAHRPGPIVELDRGRDENAPSGSRARLCPGEPALEERGQAGPAAGLPDGGLDDLVHESLGRRVEHLDLERLLGAEVREEPALGEVQLVGQASDRQPLEADLAGQARGPLQDGLPGLLSLAHRRP